MMFFLRAVFDRTALNRPSITKNNCRAAVLAVGFVCMLFYKLTEKRVREIMEVNRQNDGI